ncbi:MAG: glycosyltransferase family 9 protein [Saprospiraceae bacterium]|nr:glycosyltransferase family 9 protein [Saprospiraceae bacterium]
MKILVLRLSSIGDIVLCTPVLRALKKQLGAEVHIMTKKAFYSILEGNPYVARRIVYENSELKNFSDLKNEEYDQIIDLHKNLRTFRIIRQLRRPSISFDKINLKKWLAVNMKVNILPDKHIVDRYFEALGALGVENDDEGLDFFISERIGTEEYPEIIIALGAAHFTKMIPKSVLHEIIPKLPYKIGLVGGPGDAELGVNLAGSFQNVENYAGECSIHQSADLIRNARVILSPDTGMMHIAAALKKPLIAIWGNTVPEFGMYPYYGNHEIPHHSAEVDIGCRPCSKIGFDKCPRGHFKCMKEQNVDEIADRVRSLLDSTSMS